MEQPTSGETPTYTAFAGDRKLASADLPTMLTAVKSHLDTASDPVLIFEDATGRQVDFDFSGSLADVLARHEPPAQKGGPGRPKLGVVSREVSLLPRHWDWLEQQPQGISAALRRLVDDARKREPARERARRARDAAGKVMWSLAGNLPNFEEASRALYAADHPKLTSLIAAWPPDIRSHIERLSHHATTLAAPPG
ncbi:MAG: DUF2239 family protein [Polyangiaceae bacterium]